MFDWLWSQGLDRMWLTTEPGTRARSFYEAAGWQLISVTQRQMLPLYELPQILFGTNPQIFRNFGVFPLARSMMSVY